jgi:hypothetical protein
MTATLSRLLGDGFDSEPRIEQKFVALGILGQLAQFARRRSRNKAAC